MKLTYRTIVTVTMMWALVSCSAESFAEENQSNTSETTVINSIYSYKTSELEIINLINEYRKSIGLNELQKIDYISTICEDHNDVMIENGKMSHVDFSNRAKLLLSSLKGKKIAENLAYNYKSAQAMLDAWLASPEHKANIEGDFTHFGVSITIDAKTGKSYCTNIFVKI